MKPDDLNKYLDLNVVSVSTLMLASYTQIHKTMTEKQTHKFNFPLSVNLLALGEAVDYFLLGLARTLRAHICIRTWQHASAHPSSPNHMHKHTVYKPKLSSHRQEVMSLLVSKEMEAVAKIL